MTEKEINLKSILFLVIGILLLLSLVICIYIVNGERDLVSVEAKVVDVKKDETGTGKNDITVSYDIDETSYNYNFYYKDNIEVEDKITIYYHENNVNSVTTFKTTKLIFVCPIIGLVLCILSLFELFRQNKEEDLFKTAVIDISGTTQKLEIVTDDTFVKKYESLPEEQVEAEVKVIKKETKNNSKEIPKEKLYNNEESIKNEEKTEDWYIEVKEDQPIPSNNSKNKEENLNESNIEKLNNINKLVSLDNTNNKTPKDAELKNVNINKTIEITKNNEITNIKESTKKIKDIKTTEEMQGNRKKEENKNVDNKNTNELTKEVNQENIQN